MPRQPATSASHASLLLACPDPDGDAPGARHECGTPRTAAPARGPQGDPFIAAQVHPS